MFLPESEIYSPYLQLELGGSKPVFLMLYIFTGFFSGVFPELIVWVGIFFKDLLNSDIY